MFCSALTYAIGFVLWEIPRAHLQPEAAYADQWVDLISQLDNTKFPILTGPATQTAVTVASSSQFNWGLTRIVNH